jgi:hypothetical protein
MTSHQYRLELFARPIASPASLARYAKESSGWKLDTGGAKTGNVHLKWARSETAAPFVPPPTPGARAVAGG